MSTSLASVQDPDRQVAVRLRPLQLALFVSGIAPWVPVEKVFMTQLGFTPALVATMAAAYAAVVPVLEIPSGILADRWSRRGVLMLASGCALLSVLVGALSTGVASYIVSAMILGVFFALQSGTVDSIVYDTLIEETRSADGYEKHFGRIQMWNSAALTGSALLGGVIAGLTSPRLAYVITIPCAAAGLLLLLRFREPTLHRQVAARSTMREHLAATWRVVTGGRRVAAIVAASVLAAAALQMIFEFGPLWLLAFGVATAVFGPYTAGMTATLGLGGVLAARLRLDRPGPAIAATSVVTVGGLTLTVGQSGWLIIAGQIVLAALLATVGVHLSRLLHDAVPSDLRTGVASGVSTLSWLTFLPCSLLFGAVSRHGGVHAAGWVVLTLVATAGLTLAALSRPPRTSRTGSEPSAATQTATAFAAA
jgi:predicted MFS family arabinose efflux permease